MIIDATNLILGRMATIAAKKALLGEKIDIVNCEKSVVTGNRDSIFEKYKTQSKRGTPAKGPFIIRRPDAMVKRTIRGMIPYKRERGKNAMSGIKCYIGVPEQFVNQKFETLNEADITRSSAQNYVSVEAICKYLRFQ